MSTAEIGDLLNAVGQEAANIIGKAPNDVFVYIEAGDNWQGGAVFEDQGNRVIYHDPSRPMIKLIERLWDAADADKKWSMIHYDINDDKFSVEYFYQNDLEHDVISYDYRQDALVARYGEKPVIYPPPDDMFHDITEDDLKDLP